MGDTAFAGRGTGATPHALVTEKLAALECRTTLGLALLTVQDSSGVRNKEVWQLFDVLQCFDVNREQTLACWHDKKVTCR